MKPELLNWNEIRICWTPESIVALFFFLANLNIATFWIIFEGLRPGPIGLAYSGVRGKIVRQRARQTTPECTPEYARLRQRIQYKLQFVAYVLKLQKRFGVVWRSLAYDNCIFPRTPDYAGPMGPGL